MADARMDTQILTEFMEGINVAEGAASQLVTVQANPKWMAIRDMLGIIKEGCLARAAVQSMGGR